MAYDKIIDSQKLENDLSLLADKIREKTKTEEQLVFPEEYISSVDTLTSTTFAKGLIEGTLENLESEDITEIGDWVLYYHDSIKTMKLPNITRIGSHGCCYCHFLEIADIGKATYIDANGFGGCTRLKTLILRANEVCQLASYSLFFNSPFGSDGSGGTAYVPAALIEEYKKASNWSSLYTWGVCRFEPIEGSIYE